MDASSESHLGDAEKKAPPPPKQEVHWHKALFWHALGFFTIVMVLWADELFNLGHQLGISEERDANYLEVSAKSGVVILLWMFSAYKIYLIVSRLSYLESFLHVCAWCRKIEVEQKWFTIEQHFAQQTGVKASHGMCPECAKKLEEEYSKPTG
ncbi:MAG: hypothetical protein ABMA26_18700 [Limisphaerales bacterium]